MNDKKDKGTKALGIQGDVNTSKKQIDRNLPRSSAEPLMYTPLRGEERKTTESKPPKNEQTSPPKEQSSTPKK